MSFTFRPARRENVPLLIGLAGSSGSGKTFSALSLATGLAGGQRFAVIDTEAGRAKHYAEDFQFDHGDLAAPFRPDAYADAIAAADKAGYPVIVVDSTSHEHAGEGGLLDWHEEELQRMAGDDWKKRDAMNMAAWVKPKMSHRRFMGRLLQVRAHLILCFRAEQKIDIVKNPDTGKTEVVPKKLLSGHVGWIPICEKNTLFELALSLLLTADAPGVPKPVKLEKQHLGFVPLDQPLSEDVGRKLGEWARGGAAPKAEASVPADQERVATDEEVEAVFAFAAEIGEDAVKKARTAVDGHRAKFDGAVSHVWLVRLSDRLAAQKVAA